jgi:hypothetical protein
MNGGDYVSVSELEPNTQDWYATRMGCLTWDQTRVARLHSFPDAAIPLGKPLDPAPHSKICLSYRTSAPAGAVSSAGMMETEMAHPQFAFRPGGPGTPYQIDVESQLRRLDQPLTKIQAVIPMDAPLFRDTVAPPVPTNVPAGPQNAANPIAAVVRPNSDPCRAAADAVASQLSSRWINNPTRLDTQRFGEPFEPPGIGTPAVGAMGITAVSLGGQPMVSATGAAAGAPRASLAQVGRARRV